MTTIEQEVQDFEHWLETQTKCSGGTPGMYAAYIKRLNQPLTLNDHELDELVSILQDAVTTSAVRAAFKKYLSYLKQNRDLTIQQRRDIAFLKDELNDMELTDSATLNKSEVLRKYLKRDEVQEIVNYVVTELDASDFNARQRRYDEFRVLPLLLFETGCRISELIGKQNDPDNTGLRVADINFEENRLRIRNAKGGKDRFADFNDSAAMLAGFVDEYDITTGKVFHIPYWKQNYVFKKIGKALFGFPGPNEATDEGEYRLTAHWLRHSFATNWVIKEYQKTGRWAEAKERVHEYLDHNNMETTEAYIGAAKELERDNIFEEQGGFGIEIPKETRST